MHKRRKLKQNEIDSPKKENDDPCINIESETLINSLSPPPMEIEKDVIVDTSNKNSTKSSEKLVSDGSMTILQFLEENKTELKSFLIKWLKLYNKNEKSAMLKIFQLVMDCCGYRKNIDESLMESCEFNHSIKHQETHHSPLHSNDSTGRNRKNTVLNFFSKFLHFILTGNIIYEAIVDVIINWLVSLSVSPVRSYRISSTIIAMNFMNVMANLCNTYDDQLNLLKNSKKHPLVRSFIQDNSKTSNEAEQYEIIQGFFKRLFDSVFIHRYRDVWSDVREVCIEQLGNILISNPDHFMSHEYLKYTGWLLYDRAPNVRLASINSISMMLEAEEIPSRMNQLRLFLKRFQDRIVSMCYDVSEKVALRAINVCLRLLQNSQLCYKNVQNIEKLLLDHRKLTSNAVGMFFAYRIQYFSFAKIKRVSSDCTLVPSRSPHSDAECLSEFVEFCGKELNEMQILTVMQSCQKHLPSIINFETYKELLNDEYNLTFEHEKLILRILSLASIEVYERYHILNSQDESKTTFKFRGQTYKKKIRNEWIVECEKMYVSIMETMGNYLVKYGNDDDVSVSIMRYFTHSPIHLFESKLFDSLSKKTESIFTKTINQELIEVICQFWGNVCKYSELSKSTEIIHVINMNVVPKLLLSIRKQINEFSFDSLASGFGESILEGSAQKCNQNIEFNSTITKISILFRYFNLTSSIEMESDIDPLLSHIIDNGVSTPEFVQIVFQMCSYYLIWKVYDLEKFFHSELQITSPHEIEKTIEILNHIQCLLERGLEIGSVDVMRMSFRLLIDIFMISKSGHLKNAFNSSLSTKLTKFLQNHVLIYAQVNDDTLDSKTLENISQDVASYSKLIFSGIVSAEEFCFIFAEQFLNHNTLFEAIHGIATEIESSNLVSFTKIIFLALIQKHEKLMADALSEKCIDSKLVDLVSSLKKSYFLYGIFSTPSKKARPISKLNLLFHRLGVNYAFSNLFQFSSTTPNLNQKIHISFLSILSEYSKNLHQSDIEKPKDGAIDYFQSKMNAVLKNDRMSPNILHVSVYMKSLRSIGKESFSSHIYDQNQKSPTEVYCSPNRDTCDDLEHHEASLESHASEETFTIGGSKKRKNSNIKTPTIKKAMGIKNVNQNIMFSTPASLSLNRDNRKRKIRSYGDENTLQHNCESLKSNFDNLENSQNDILNIDECDMFADENNQSFVKRRPKI